MNFADALPLGTLTVAGTLNLALLLVAAVVVPETVCESVTVQIVDVERG